MSTSKESIRVVKPGQTYVGKQGITYGASASADTVGAKQVCMAVMPMPPGAKAKAHYHEGIETIAYMMQGECNVYYGDQMEFMLTAHAGDTFYCPENVPHAPYNQGASPCTWVVVHSSGNDQEGIVMLPELDLILAKK